jgi:hypothetical protein
MQVRLPSGWYSRGGEVGQDVEAEMDGHGVARGVVDREACEEEKGCPCYEMDMGRQTGCPSLCSRRRHGCLGGCLSER